MIIAGDRLLFRSRKGAGDVTGTLLTLQNIDVCDVLEKFWGLKGFMGLMGHDRI
jgi:hypothetical protein